MRPFRSPKPADADDNPFIPTARGPSPCAPLVSATLVVSIIVAGIMLGRWLPL